ncbi:hypothetical protein TSUD_31080 [Trifolium subterraneum]|uniref:Uncharacterized protein n=1 Tax=Trifolium subterraneum TaxID=3900 RepID=A0A2Z6M085_TRISU|nr:hypothetical protein TSUD_31080 [Trifolium subterraneum]
MANFDLTKENLVPYVGSDVQGFNGATTKPWGYVDLIVTFGEDQAMKSVKVKFLVVDCPSLYNCIIGRPTLVEFTEDAVELDARTSKKERKQEKKAMEDDLLVKEDYRPIPDGEFELVPLGEDPTKGIKIRADLPDLVKRQLKACLRENAELFPWSAAEMPRIDPEVTCHQLTIDPRASVVVQRRRKQSPEKAEAAKKAVKDLLEANFIAEAQACPKDAYPLPNNNINKLVDNSSGFKLLSFMDVYSGYNQTAFMTETGTTYQRMMNKVYHNEIGDMLEVYMDDMIVKSEEESDHTIHLKKVFEQARKFNMRFNPEKCTFEVKAWKFLSFYLTERGIEPNPDKFRAFFDYPTPKSKKSIQTLNGMLTSMARFIAKSAQHVLPLFNLLRKETTFEWTEECEEALQHLKRALSEPPVLTRPIEGETLYLYLAVASEAISAVLIRETEQGQKPVFFLRYYFLAHSIVVRTDQSVKQLLARPDMVSRMLKWSLELSEFDITFESRKALKAQVLADFITEMTTSTTSDKNKWTIFVDGSSNSQGSGADIILENGDGVLVEVSLGLLFPTTNNQTKYETFLTGLRLADDMGAEEIKIYTDSQLVASQVSGEYQTKEERLLEYLNLIKEKLAKFKETEVKHVPREHNSRADVLSKLATTRRKKMAPVYNFLKTNTLPADAKEAAKIKRRTCSYVLLDDKLYQRGFSIPLLKCVEETRMEFILQEIHEGINGKHIGGHSLPRKALRAGYYWPTMQRDTKDHVLKCDKCQRHGDIGSKQNPSQKSVQHTYFVSSKEMCSQGSEPQVVVTDNGTQFTNKKFQEFLANIGTTQHFTFVEHPQTNGQAEAANRVILRGLRRRMRAAKGNWTEELHNVLWSYRTTQHYTTGETPFRLTYGTEAVIPVETGEPSPRIEYPHEEDINDELLREELDLVEELRIEASPRSNPQTKNSCSA